LVDLKKVKYNTNLRDNESQELVDLKKFKYNTNLRENESQELVGGHTKGILKKV
jgi:hypothetical protein